VIAENPTSVHLTLLLIFPSSRREKLRNKQREKISTFFSFFFLVSPSPKLYNLRECRKNVHSTSKWRFPIRPAKSKKNLPTLLYLKLLPFLFSVFCWFYQLRLMDFIRIFSSPHVEEEEEKRKPPSARARFRPSALPPASLLGWWGPPHKRGGRGKEALDVLWTSSRNRPANSTRRAAYIHTMYTLCFSINQEWLFLFNRVLGSSTN